MMGIRLYCGVTEKKWNHHPVMPGKYACVSPVMGSSIKGRQESRIYVPEHTNVIQDSGAFCDGINTRLSYKDALQRQIDHADKYEYDDLITHRASYDLLIDEKWNDDGIRRKERWSEEDAERACNETIESAHFLHQHRNRKNLVLSAQGVTTKQYMKCAEEIAPLVLERDMFGLGGWCILGIKKNKIRPSFREIISVLIPFISDYGVRNVHIWGVVYPFPLGELLWLCDEYNINLSTDSSGPQKRPIFGTWGYGDWKDRSYEVPPVETRGIERALHVEKTRRWLNNFRDTKYYKPPNINSIWRE